MAVKIQIKRGSKAGLPALAPGEYGLATDTAELFVGGSSGNLQIPVLDSTGKVPSSQLPEMDYDPAGSAEAVQTSLTAHVNDKDNPHGVTAEQVGAVNKLYVDDAIDEATAGSIKLSEIEVLLPANGYWRSIIYGNGKFVVVGYNSNNAAYSTNGINWTAATLPSSKAWQAVTYGDGKFVAIASQSSVSAYSTDGINWIGATMPSDTSWKSVAYGNGKFVAVSALSNSNTAVYSTDGINWYETTLPIIGGLYSVTYGNGRFVAVANRSNTAVYSTDGINWYETTLPSDAQWESVAYGNGKFVTVANSSANNSNKAAYSTDGINWTAATLPSYAGWRSVTYGNGKFVAVAGTNNAAYSTNGINWTAATLPSSKAWQAVTYGDGKFVAVAKNSYDAAYSYDGITWLSTAQVLTDSAGDDITDDVAQALGVSKIVTGSYTGTGTYGSSNPNSLTFDFDVKLLILQNAYGYAVLPVIFTQGETEYYTYYMSGSISNAKMTVSFDGHTISWYTSSTNGSQYGNSAENMQFNRDGEIYYYAAIG